MNLKITLVACLALSVGAAALAAPHGQKQSGEVYVKMVTSKGDIVLELNRGKAPITVDNFMKYVDAKFYDGTVFHRVIPGFMIQGGGFGTDGSEKKTREPIKNEWQNGLKNARGTISMARTQVADSATSQFFINVKDNDMLDTPRDGAAYAVFGKVVQGMDVADKIVNSPRGQHTLKMSNNGTLIEVPSQDVPNDPIVIKSVRRLSAAEVKALTTKPGKH